MTEHEKPREKPPEPPPDRPAPSVETTRPTDISDEPPPMNAPARGPLDQGVPDVATGSTPVTRKDD